MPRIPTAVIPKTVFAAIHQSKSRIEVSQALVDSAKMDSVAIFQKFETRREGLSEAEASARLVKFGPNVFAKDQRVGIGVLIWHVVLNPLVILLAVLAGISFAANDVPELSKFPPSFAKNSNL